ncbi:MAG: hypothetical protein GY777_30485 [Candidatus Brocadiaceae bacterium]|nr:hypothetical protein [Candidatus Brocadiaceae bacterium]
MPSNDRIKATLSNERLVLLSFWSDDRPLFREDSSIGILSKERNMFLLSLAWTASEPVRAGSQ